MRHATSADALSKAFYLARAVGDFRTTWVSPNVKSITGFAADRFVREPGLWLSRMHEDDIDYAREALVHLVSRGSASVEYRWKFADDVYYWVRNDAVIMQDCGKRRDTIIGSWHLLSASQARHVVGARNGASVAILSSDGTIHYASRHVGRLLGQPPTELVGRRVSDFVHPEDLVRSQRLLAECMRTPGVPLLEEVRYVRRPGGWRRLETVAAHWADVTAPDRLVATLHEVAANGNGSRSER